MTGLRVILAGAALGNGNRGIEALALSVMGSVSQHSPDTRLTVLDDGWGIRSAPGGRHPQIQVEYAGVRRSRRWHRPESWARIRLAQSLRLGNPVADRFREADAVLDLSGGDSFTDLYGAARLAAVSAPKQAALRAGRPLVLLPQTYGPFTTPAARRLAERLVRSSTLAYSRDARSHEILADLAGPDAAPSRLVEGVDVAFALEPRRPGPEVEDLLVGDSAEPVVGVNPSGLLFDDAAHARFGLAGSYLDTMTSVVRALLSAGAHVVFVPHVHEAGGSGESDILAISRIREELEPGETSRTITLPTSLDAAEVKWCIERLDWFVGSRMHATIAALSTMTPTAGYAYSDKTLGVFRTCGMGEHVVDARTTSGDDAVAAIMSSFERRAEISHRLRDSVPATVDASREQLRDLLGRIVQWREAGGEVEAIA